MTITQGNTPEIFKKGQTTFEINWESFTYPPLVQDLKNWISIWEFKRKFENYVKKIWWYKVFSLWWFDYNLEISWDLHWNDNEKVEIFSIMRWCGTLEKYIEKTKQLLWENTIIEDHVLKSITKEDRDLFVSMYHFYIQTQNTTETNLFWFKNSIEQLL